MTNKQETSKTLGSKDLNTKTVPAVTASHSRRLRFSRARNFRDLGGYQAADGRSVRWGVLYRSDSLYQLSKADLNRLSGLGLDRIVDFRSALEKDLLPDRLPSDLIPRLVEIPILDSSTQLLQHSRDEMLGKLKEIDPVRSLTTTYVELATRFTPEMIQFIDVLFSSIGRPILFHCTAGKDRTGFAAAILLRMLGVPPDVVMEDYLLTNQYFFAAHRWRVYMLRAWKGKLVAETVAGMMRAQPAFLSAAFEAIDNNYGSFEEYVRTGLKLADADVGLLKSQYLE